MPPTEHPLELHDVSYRYPGSSHGVDGLTFAARRESIFGLVGVNGAGKTTIIRLMTGLLTPSAGRVLCLGNDVQQNRKRVMQSVGSLIEVPSLYHHLTGAEHLRIFAEYTEAPRSAITRVLDLVGLGDVGPRKIADYSLGMKQRLGIATALLHDPAILILDEPTNGLDPMGIADMRRIVLDLAHAHGKAVIVSSHLLAEVEKTVSRLAIIHEGRLHFEGTPEDLAARANAAARLHIRVSSPARALELVGGELTPSAPDVIMLPSHDPADVSRVIRRLTDAGIDVYEARRDQPSLERDFLALMEGHDNG